MHEKSKLESQIMTNYLLWHDANDVDIKLVTDDSLLNEHNIISMSSSF